METSPQTEKDSKNINENVNSLLEGVNSKKFSEDAYNTLKIKINSYISDLIGECIKVGQRDRVDSVSAKHVDIAEERLKQHNPKRIYKHMGNIGGILMGTCLPNIISYIDTGKSTPLIFVVTFLAGIFGASFLVVSFMKD